MAGTERRKRDSIWNLAGGQKISVPDSSKLPPSELATVVTEIQRVLWFDRAGFPGTEPKLDADAAKRIHDVLAAHDLCVADVTGSLSLATAAAIPDHTER